MEVIIGLLLSIAFAVLLRKQIKKYPVVFYLIAVAIDIVYLGGLIMQANRKVGVAFEPYLTRGVIGFGLLTIVMYIGVFEKGSKVRAVIGPIRGELSIIASILIAGHVINYFMVYIVRALQRGSLPLQLTISIAVSILLIILLLPLAITSFSFIKKKMKPRKWKRLQRWAYVFYGLVYVHLAVILLPAALAGGKKAMISVIAYTIIFVVYAIARIRRASIDKKKAGDKPVPILIDE